MNRLILFTSFYFATKAEKVLQPLFAVKLIPTPPQLDACCGLCLLCEAEALTQILETLRAQKISYFGIYTYEGVHAPCERVRL